jgi:hypothetical protein
MFFIIWEQQWRKLIEPFKAAFTTYKFLVRKESINVTQNSSNILLWSWQDLPRMPYILEYNPHPNPIRIQVLAIS